MGKKIKKGRNPVKVQCRASAGSPKSVLEGSSPNVDSSGDRDKEACNHCTQSNVVVNRILLKLRSSSTDALACEHCREETVSRKGGKEKGKQPKKKGLGKRAADAKSENRFLWVCLDCGQFFCGGEVNVLEPYGHARRHAKQERHQWAVRADNPLISWCYSCSSSVPIQLPEETVEEENVTTLNKNLSFRGNALEPLDLEKLRGYKVRGLSNLGNTCFFNSVMQNFFAMDLLRDTLMGLDRPVGPLLMAIKELFGETSRTVDSKVVVNPKALFGCICAKAPQFRGFQQQDSHELLRCLLDELQMEETNTRKTSKLSYDHGKINEETGATLVAAIFGGRLSSTVSCMECGHTSVVNEPFLDLSLPVPKRRPSKKLMAPLKSANQRDKNRSRRFRERSFSQTSNVIVSQKEQVIEQPSECSGSGIIVPEKVHDNPFEDPDSTWIDYLGGESPNCDYVCANELENSVVQRSFSKLINEIESNIQSVSELHNEAECNGQSVPKLHNDTEICAQFDPEFHTANCSNDLKAPSNTSIKTLSKVEVPHTYVPIPGVMLYPFKNSQEPNFTNPANISMSESFNANSLCKQVEEDFDGFGDLFNEPEVTSGLREATGAGEHMDVRMCTDDISESNMEEVDDTNAPVSIYSCLALFTKPELLSDEQAWYCEHCSEMVPHVNRELRTSKLKDAKVFDESVTLNLAVNEDDFQNKRFSSDSHRDSLIVKVLDNEKSVSSPKNVITSMDGHLDQIGITNYTQKPVCPSKGSHNSGECSNGTLHLAETASCSNMACVFDVLDKEMTDPEIFQNFSPQVAETATCSQESSFHGIKDPSSIGTDGKEPEVTSHSLQSDTNALQKYDNDKSQEVSLVRKKGLKSSSVHPAKEHKGKGIKIVKRDATKRILIDRLPPILTIHLKRFSQDGRGRLSKLGGHVNFQETLDMRPYMDPRCAEDRSCYSLVGVVEHSGSMSQGHYVAYVRGGRGRESRASAGSSSTGKAWFHASDAYVRDVSVDEVLRSEAYILFYEKI